MEPLARPADPTMLLQVLSVTQGRSKEVGPAVAIMRLTFAVVVELDLLLPPPTTPLLLVDHNFLHSRRLLPHPPRRRSVALNATGVPLVAG